MNRFYFAAWRYRCRSGCLDLPRDAKMIHSLNAQVFNRPNCLSGAPKPFATADQIHPAQSPEAVLNLRKPDSEYQATDQSVQQEQLRPWIPRYIRQQPRFSLALDAIRSR